MATVVFSALGAGLGSSIGGSLLGLSMTAVGRFAGAMIGRSIDNRLSAGGGRDCRKRQIRSHPHVLCRRRCSNSDGVRAHANERSNNLGIPV